MEWPGSRRSPLRLAPSIMPTTAGKTKEKTCGKSHSTPGQGWGWGQGQGQWSGLGLGLGSGRGLGVAQHAVSELRPRVALSTADRRRQQRLLETVTAVAVGVAPAGLILGRLRTRRVPSERVAPHAHTAQAHIARQVGRCILQCAEVGIEELELARQEPHGAYGSE